MSDSTSCSSTVAARRLKLKADTIAAEAAALNTELAQHPLPTALVATLSKT